MNNSASAKAKRTTIQAFIGAVVAFFVGLGAVVWAVPGVPEAVTNYLVQQAVPIALSLGVPAGLVSGGVAYFQNRGR